MDTLSLFYTVIAAAHAIICRNKYVLPIQENHQSTNELAKQLKKNQSITVS